MGPWGGTISLSVKLPQDISLNLHEWGKERNNKEQVQGPGPEIFPHPNLPNGTSGPSKSKA